MEKVSKLTRKMAEIEKWKVSTLYNNKRTDLIEYKKVWIETVDFYVIFFIILHNV